jgi:mycothiol synthase
MAIRELEHEITETALPAGYTARAARMEDIEAVVEMLNACQRVDTGESMTTVELTRAEWTSPDFDPTQDVLLAFSPDGDLAGYIEVWCGNPFVRAYIFGRTHPDHRGLGIGGYLLRWSEDRSAQFIDKAPPEARFFIRTGTDSANGPARDLFEDRGFTLVRHFYRMVVEMDPGAPPPEPVWPDGVRVRKMVRGQDERALYDAVCASFCDHWGFVESDDYEEWLHWFDNDPGFDPDLHFLAVADGPDGEQVAGFARCRPFFESDPEMGWVDTLGVVREFRRQGIATALLYHAFREYLRRGKLKVGLGVDASSLTGATRLYENVGMYVARQSDAYEKELRAGRDLSTQTLEAAQDG